LPDEVIGFPAGFLQAGIPGVVSTLWSIDDISTALLITQFYHYHLDCKLLPSQALRHAQLWLQDATAKELMVRFGVERNKPADEKMMSYKQISSAWRRFAALDPDKRPFEHPYYWAAFTFTGS
jgi:CHAT domain-containing protein